MSILKNIFRAPKRSALLFAIAFLLALMLMSVIFLKGFADDGINEAVGPLGGCIEGSTEAGSSPLTLRQARTIAESFGVIEDMYASVSNACDIVGAEHIKPNTDTEVGGLASKFAPFGLNAVTETETLEEFYSGRFRIVEGTGISRTHNDKKSLIVLVSRQIAELNGIKLGDAIKLEYDVFMLGAEVNTVFYVGGIYDVVSSVQQVSALPYVMPVNQIYIPLSVYEELTVSAVELAKDTMYVSSLYYRVENPSRELAEALQQRVRMYETPGYCDFCAKLFDPAGEAEVLYKLSNVLTVAVAAIGLGFFSVLLAVLVWSLRMRMREIGIYCALGVKRHRIAGLISGESLIIFMAAFVGAVISFSGIAIFRGRDIYSALFTSSSAASIHSTSVDSYFGKVSEISELNAAFSTVRGVMEEFVLPAVLFAGAVMIASCLLVAVLFYIYLRNVEVMDVMGGAKE